MSTLTIEDLKVNTGLDKVAMRAIPGGFTPRAMVVPSNDSFIANGNPATALDHVAAQRTSFIIVSPYDK